MRKSSVRWHGSHNLYPLYFYYEEKPNQPDHLEYMRRQFGAMTGKIAQLLLLRDGNGCPVIELIATPSGPVRRPYVAYRFTSDWAYRRYGQELRSVGLSLGHGYWDPHRDSSSVSHELMTQPLLEEAAAS